MVLVQKGESDFMIGMGLKQSLSDCPSLFEHMCIPLRAFIAYFLDLSPSLFHNLSDYSVQRFASVLDCYTCIMNSDLNNLFINTQYSQALMHDLCVDHMSSVHGTYSRKINLLQLIVLCQRYWKTQSGNNLSSGCFINTSLLTSNFLWLFFLYWNVYCWSKLYFQNLIDLHLQ